MERINLIIHHPDYVKYLEKIRQHETNRIFCKHDMVHFLDVCRIAENIWLRYCLRAYASENRKNETLSEEMKEYIYAAGLLHDIGRWLEYEKGIRHELASAELAVSILRDCGFNEAEQKDILTAISNHRNASVKNENTLSGWIYQADKRSRSCFVCEAETVCDWSPDKKNLKLT